MLIGTSLDAGGSHGVRYVLLGSRGYFLTLDVKKPERNPLIYGVNQFICLPRLRLPGNSFLRERLLWPWVFHLNDRKPPEPLVRRTSIDPE